MRGPLLLLMSAVLMAQRSALPPREAFDREVKKNPWPYIGGAAAAALLIGYAMGSSRR